VAFLDTLSSAVAKFFILSSGAREIEESAVTVAAKFLLERAKAAIGTYEFGWVPLAPATIAGKGADTPLLETGQMRDSGFYEVHGPNAIIGFTDEKIVYHEYGTSRIPPRPVVGGTIDKYGEHMAHLLAVSFGETIVEVLEGRGIGAAIFSASSRHRT
jgi:hypothetical protein